jgi:hypothetical protein
MIAKLVVVAALAAALAAGASAAPTALRTCGTVKGGGATWSVGSFGVSCSTAKPLIRKLAGKPHPSLRTDLGTFRGLRCVELARGATRGIQCYSANGSKGVIGVTPVRK